MAIRIRQAYYLGKIYWVALCAAETKEQKGDIYLDDNAHHALASKFAIDMDGEGLKTAEWADPILAKLMKKEESKEGGD